MNMLNHGDDREKSAQRSALMKVLLLNVALVAGLLAAGVWANSSALIANALDNASDAFVYGISYYAVGRSQRTKARAAMTSGVLLIILSVGVLVDVVRRFVTGTEPFGMIMIPIAIVAAVANAVCLKLLSSYRQADVNLRAAWTFSINDFLANFGVVVAGALALWLRRQWPDLVVGSTVAFVTAYGGVGIVRDARRSRKEEPVEETQD